MNSKYIGMTPTVITIDIDNLHKMKHYERLIIILRIAYICRIARCRIARTHKGYHVYISVDNYNFEKSIGLRGWLGDDTMRIDIDILRWRRGLKRWVETLFTCKKQKEYSYCEEDMQVSDLLREYVVGWWRW